MKETSPQVPVRNQTKIKYSLRINPMVTDARPAGNSIT